jgi:hypothetical protein
VLAVPPPAKSPAARILAGAVDSIIVDVATESTTYQDVAAALAEVTRIAEPWTTAAPHAQPVIVLTAGRSSRMSHSALRKREVKDKIRLKTDLGQDSGLKRTLPAASETAKKPKTSDMEKDGAQGSDKTNVAVEGGSP